MIADAGVPDDADARGPDGAERNRRAVGHRSRHPVAARAPGERRHPARAAAGRRAVEARYVGTFGRDIWRGTDFNQVQISPDFLADFNRARSNGYLAQQAGLAFSPVFNPAVPGSAAADGAAEFRHRPAHQQHGRSATSRRTRSAALADFYMTSRVAGCARDVHAESRHLRVAGHRRTAASATTTRCSSSCAASSASGFFGQMNYTLSEHATPTRRARRRTASRRSWTTSGPS